MELQRFAVTVGIHLAVGVLLMVLHFLGFVGPEPQPVWPWSPPPSPLEPAESIELFRVARGYVTGVWQAAFVLCGIALARDAIQLFGSGRVVFAAGLAIAAQVYRFVRDLIVAIVARFRGSEDRR